MWMVLPLNSENFKKSGLGEEIFSFEQVETEKSLGYPGGKVLTLTLILAPEQILQI